MASKDTLKFGNRVNFVGATGSGKTSTAKRLAKILGLPFVEIDALFWEANWTRAPEDVFRGRVHEAARGDRWVIDGNYSRVQPFIWRRVDTVIWLDYSLRAIFWQLLCRTLRRVRSQEELWAGNKERWRNAFASRDSLFLWLLTSYWRRRRRYARAAASPENSHIYFVRLSAPSETRKWLDDLELESRSSGTATPAEHSQQ